MGCCTIAAAITGKDRGTIQDRALRRLYEHGPRQSFLDIRDRLIGRVLEVGCGTGVMFSHYPPTAHVIGIEPDGDFLPLARRHAETAAASIDVVAGDVQHLSFPTLTFDAAIIQLVMCMVPDPQRGLQEVVRVLRPGGLIYVYEHVLSTHAVYRLVQHATSRVWTWMSEGCHWNRDTPAVVRGIPLRVEQEERLRLRSGVGLALPIFRMVARKP